MSNIKNIKVIKFAATIILLAGVVFLLSGFFLNQKSDQSKNTTTKTPEVKIEEPKKVANLKLVSRSDGGKNYFDIVLEPNGAKANVVESKLSFDASILKITDLSYDSNWSVTPISLKKESLKDVKGSFDISIFTTKPLSSNSIVLATFTFEKLQSSPVTVKLSESVVYEPKAESAYNVLLKAQDLII